MGSNDKRYKKKSSKGSNVLTILLAILCVILAATLAFVLLFKEEPEQPDIPVSTETEYPEKWEEGTVRYKDKNYKYNSALNIYLLMGIDKDGVVEPAKDYVSGGQSDAMFLFIMNKETEEVSVISINRNTMTRIETYNENGINTGYVNAQICTQHGFGDGRRVSCNLAQEAVSHLFYNLPIDGYISLNVGAVPLLNDAIGGVELEVMHDLSYPDRGVQLTAGEVVTLSGQEAYIYLRGRDVNEFDSATHRLRRQEQYITAYLEKLEGMINGSSSKLVSMYEEVSPYVVSNMEVTDLLEEITSYEYSKERLYTVPGETVMGEEFEEFHVDEDALYELIIDVFYIEVE